MITQTVIAEKTWSAVLGELQLQVPSSTYETWLKNTTGLSLENQILVVSVPNAFTAEWLEKRIFRLVHMTAQKVSRKSLQVQFRIENNRTARPEPVISSSAKDPQPPQIPENTPNPRYSFDSFVVGSSNDLAYTAAHTVALCPGKSYNPLFIYSGPGLGKTHLLQAIARKCAEQRLKFLYVTSEQFTNDFITSIRQRTTTDFRSRYRSVDVLLMDDVQFLNGKEQTQEGFFHPFNDLHTTNRQVVITSDQPPYTMPSLESRLRSRFSWGLIVDIQQPSLETRIAILQKRSQALQLSVSQEVLTYIAQRVYDNIRSLEGVLNRVAIMAGMNKTIIDIATAAKALQGLVQDIQRYAKYPEQVLPVVAQIYNIRIEDLIGKKRLKELVAARQLAMYILHTELQIPVTRVGRIMGGRTHATVIHGVEKITSELKNNPDFSHQLWLVKQGLTRYP